MAKKSLPPSFLKNIKGKGGAPAPTGKKGAAKKAMPPVPKKK